MNSKSKIESILVFGSGGHAKVVIDLLRKLNIPIAGIVEKKGASNRVFEGITVVATDDQLDSIPYRVGIIAIGDNYSRLTVAQKIKSHFPDFEFPSLIHPNACIGSGVNIGEGTVIMAGAVVNSGAKIGAHCIINTRAAIDHDCSIADFASINPGSVLGGNVRVGEASVVGLGAAIIHGIAIGSDTVVGAGAVVTKDIDGLVVAYGNPCREIRHRKQNDPYL